MFLFKRAFAFVVVCMFFFSNALPPFLLALMLVNSADFLLLLERFDAEHVVLRGDGHFFTQTCKPVSAFVHEFSSLGHLFET